MAVELRRALAADIPAMHRIRLSVQENRLTDPARLGEADYIPYLGEFGATWVAICEGRIGGFVAIDLADHSIWALFVDPASEGRGLGKQLMACLIDFAKDVGLAKLWLVTVPGTRAEKFYFRNGWQLAGTQANGESRLTLNLT